MDTLWLTSGLAQYFKAPDQQLMVSNQGKLLADAEACMAKPLTIARFEKLCAGKEVIILLADEGLFDEEYIELIPSSMAKVALLTEQTTTELRAQLNALEVDGYVTSAMPSKDFHLAINKIIDDKKIATTLQEELKNFSNIAFTAMSSASEMGVVTVFAEKIQEVMDLERLAQLIFGCLKDFKLEGALQFSFDEDVTVFPKTVTISQRRLLQGTLTAQARIISHGRFLLFSFNHLQLLVTDAPADDMERYGRLLDVLAQVVSIAEARAKTLRVNQLLKAQQDNTRMVMMLLEMASKDNRNSVKDIMNNLSLSLRDLALGMDLTLAQENAMLKLSEQALNSLETLQEATVAVEEHFRSLLQQLDNVASLLEAPVSDADADNETEDSDGNVCLF